MQFEVDGKPFRVSFEHRTWQKGHGHESTIANIYSKDADQWLLVSSGEAWLHPKDTYHHETGRKLSLRDALMNHPYFTYEKRAKIFEQFLGRRKAHKVCEHCGQKVKK